MISSEQAWIVREWVAGRTQADIAMEVRSNSSAICLEIKDFCDKWTVIDVEKQMLYGAERKTIAVTALNNYLGGMDRSIKRPGEKPKKRVVKRPEERRPFEDIQMMAAARHEHAWLLRAEGLKLQEIANHFGMISRERVRQMIMKFGRRVKRATRRTMWKFNPEGEVK
jgi:hypothetical protein